MNDRTVTFEKASGSEVNLVIDGTVVGCLDVSVGSNVASAIGRGQAFTAVIENVIPTYSDKLKPTGAQVDIRVEYMLEKGRPAIETERCWRCADATETPRTARSFFTTVAGVTFEGRQRIVARCSEGETLTLLRDPNNRFDKGAVKVMRLNGEQLGFIPAHVSRDGDSSGLAARMDRGGKYRCRIKNITGGGPGKSLGVNIEITEGDWSDDAIHEAPSATPGARAVPTMVHPAFLWVFAIIIVGCVLWAVFSNSS